MTLTSVAAERRTPNKVDRFLFRNRPWGVALVVVPVSAVARATEAIRDRLPGRAEQTWRSAGEHERTVAQIADRVREWAALPEAGRPALRTHRSSAASFSVRQSNKGDAMTLDVSGLDGLLALDQDAGTITVEPQATVGQITTALLPYGLMLQATLEMEEATIGGLALSQGLTTHSHQCGWVHDTVTEWEYVTGCGEVLRASADENADVFACSGMSQGTLGFLTALTLRVVPAAQEVLVTYEHVGSFDALQDRMIELMAGEDDFLEAITYAPDHAVIVRGVVTAPDDAEAALADGVVRNRQGDWHRPWFFSHVEHVEQGRRELMPIRDYLMRHDRCMCMTMKSTFPLGNTAPVRWALGWAFPPKMSVLKGMQTPAVRELTVREHVYQDVCVPAQRYADLLRLVDTAFGNYPLLVYPSRWRDRGGLQRHPDGRRGSVEAPRDAWYLNLGLYGPPPNSGSGGTVLSRVRSMLAWVREQGGYQHSYFDVFQTREEYAEQLDLDRLRAARERIGSQLLPEPYDKVRCELPWQGW